MSQSIIRYRTKPDQADANADLVRAVYAELHRSRPDGFRYTTLRLDDQGRALRVMDTSIPDLMAEPDASVAASAPESAVQ